MTCATGSATRGWALDALDRLIADTLAGRPGGPAGTDVQGLPARAALHGVGALLHAALERAPEAAPAAVRLALRQHALRAAALDLDARRELPRLLQLAADAGVHPLLIKGTPLAHTHYPQAGLRERADTDLLVRPAERGRLLALLAAQGYQRAASSGGELASSEASFWKDGSPLVLDVHWRINNSPLLSGVLPFEELESASLPVAALGPHARAPGAVHAVLLAAMHRATHFQSPFYAGAVTHRGDRLIWLYDLHLLVPALTASQGEALVEHATRHRVAGLCLDALRATQEAFGTPLPGALTDPLERAAVQPEPSMVFLHGGPRRMLLAELRALRGWTERGRWLREHALPPADYMLRKYATHRRWLLPALYVRRAFGWLAR